MNQRALLIFLLPVAFAGTSCRMAASEGTVKDSAGAAACISGSAVPGDSCGDGTVFLGAIGGVKYATSPAGCHDVPDAQRSHPALQSDYSDNWPISEFEPIECTGDTDFVTKFWSGGKWVSSASVDHYDIPDLSNYADTEGIGYGSINGDARSGAANTVILAAITSYSHGGYHPAALYCEKLVLGGHDDWFLPNRFELNAMYEARAALRLETSSTYGRYWSSTEGADNAAWIQDMSSGDQYRAYKETPYLIRCIRRL